jgi:DNA-3-methyladenine glycosylase I
MHGMLATRCPWCGDDPLSVAYHDEEWGLPSTDERHLFEMLVLEGFQAGLSWRTILAKRASFRRAFHRFDWRRVARYGDADVRRLLADAGIVRHRGKIEGAIASARALVRLHAEGGGLSAIAWAAVGRTPIVNGRRRLADVPPVSAESTALSKELRRRGFAFVGPTTVYAFMQACGLVNDHLVGCPRHAACARAGRRMARLTPGRRSGKKGRKEASRE